MQIPAAALCEVFSVWLANVILDSITSLSVQFQHTEWECYSTLVYVKRFFVQSQIQKFALVRIQLQSILIYPVVDQLQVTTDGINEIVQIIACRIERGIVCIAAQLTLDWPRR